eukprot:8882144-Karenia_brevis.AAC.1
MSHIASQHIGIAMNQNLEKDYALHVGFVAQEMEKALAADNQKVVYNQLKSLQPYTPKRAVRVLDEN